MSDFEIVRRPRLEPHSGSGADPGADWRRFVLDQVDYDEVTRERTARWADRRLAFRRFLGGVIYGLALYGLAFAVVLAALSWREGRFDRYLPHKTETAEPPPPRWARESPPVEAKGPDRHVNQPNPLYARAASPPADTDDDSPAQADATPSGDDD